MGAMATGRPTLYRDTYPEQARRLCLLGLTDEELAEFFEVDVRTIYRWDGDHPEFCQARARGKLHADAKVAEKMYHRALGYRHSAVKIFMPAGAKEPVYADYTEHYPPDTAAGTLWLSNRQGGKWKVKSDVKHTHNLPAARSDDAALLAIATAGSGDAAPTQGDQSEPE